MTVRLCPICKKPAADDYRPFCSRRCADVDLQRWLNGRYVLDDDHENSPKTSPRDERGEPPPES